MGISRKVTTQTSKGKTKKKPKNKSTSLSKPKPTPKISFNETFFRALIEHNSNAITLINSEGIVIYDSPAASGMLGYSPTEWIGKNGFELVHPDDLQEVQTLFANLVKTKAGQAKQIFRVRHKDNHWVWLDVVATNLLAQPSVQAIVVNYRDITQLKQAEETLNQSEEQFRLVFESSPSALLVVDKEGKIQSTNTRAQDLFGYPSDELIGKAIEVLIPERHRSSHVSSRVDYYLNPIPYPLGSDREIVGLHKNGTEFPIEIGLAPFESQQGMLTLASIIDITSRKQTEQALRDSETRFRAFVTASSDAIYRMSADWQEMFHLEGKDFIPNTLEPSRTWLDKYIHLDDQAFVLENIHKAIDSKSMFALEHHILRVDGSLGWTFSRAVPILDANGEIVEWFGTATDISERKQAEATLNDANQRALIEYEQLLERLNTLAHSVGTARDIPSVFRSLLQFLLASVPCSGLFVSQYDEGRQERTCIYAWSEGEEYDPSTLPVMPMTDSPHSRAVATGEIIVTGNLTEILNTQPHIDLGLEHDPRLPDSSIAVPLSVRGRVIGGFEVQSTQPDAYHTEHITAMRMAATLAAISMENVQLLDHLQRSNVELEHRVTERTAELNKTNLELEYANRAKDEFLANMSHELRTPLNSILGLSESMLEQYRDTLSENQQRSLQTIESSGKHLLDLINDVLDLAKIEAGKLDHYPQSINVDDLCKSSLIFVKTQTMKKNITLTYEIEDTIADFSADPRRLKQILVNLLTNAVKFTPNNGHVTLKVNVTQGVIQFSVIDTGIGIAPEDLRRLFTPFVQVESSLNRRFEGTGLGLALVHKLTDLHGGCIEVESEVGKGSRFTIKLPYQRNVSGQTNEAEISISHPVVEANFQPKIKSGNQKILLVEDNQANILTIGEYLENHGYEIVIANDGVQAIEKANEINPDIILMDIQMPLMDGIEATRRLRSDVRFASTPIIALTALVMPGDRERCLESGANEYISKPVSPKELRKIIETFLNK